MKIVDISLYNDFVDGKNSKPLMDIYKDSDLGDWLVSKLLNRDESYEEEGKTIVTVDQNYKIFMRLFLSQSIRIGYIIR